MVPLNHREGDLHKQRLASDGVVRTTTGKEGVDPVGALAHRAVFPVVPEADRHRQADVRPVRVGQAVPQGDADVVGLDIQLVKRGELGRITRPERQRPE